MLYDGKVDAMFLPRHAATLLHNANCDLANLDLGAAPPTAEAVVYQLPVEYVAVINGSHSNSDELNYALDMALKYLKDTG